MRGTHSGCRPISLRVRARANRAPDGGACSAVLHGRDGGGGGGGRSTE